MRKGVGAMNSGILLSRILDICVTWGHQTFTFFLFTVTRVKISVIDIPTVLWIYIKLQKCNIL